MWHSWLVGLSQSILLAQGPAKSAPAPAASAGAAAESAGKGGGGAGVFLEQIALFGGIFALFYFLIIRPQRKRDKEHKAFVESLRVGSRVVTQSGIFGKVVSIDDNKIGLEIADKVVIRVLRRQIAGLEANAEQVAEGASRS
jgi:preprotein translocase subunit YajC